MVCGIGGVGRILGTAAVRNGATGTAGNAGEAGAFIGVTTDEVRRVLRSIA
jgi:hypothetical protein